MYTEIIIRPEQPTDYTQIRTMTASAFAAVFGSGEDEVALLEALRAAPDHDPELALVAVQGEVVLGHILMSPVSIEGDEQEQWPALCLAPLCVRIDHQRQGIGNALIRAALEQAREKGHTRVVLSGSDAYYPRFGFQDANFLGIKDEMGTPSPHFMVLPLIKGALTGVSGVVRYPAAFDTVRDQEA